MMAISVNPLLADYLAGLRVRRWQPGVFDCGIFMADWVLLRCGRDPIADVRGAYRTERQFLRILRREGGFERSCAARLARAGFAETHAPQAGDLALVLSPYGRSGDVILRRPVGAIAVSATLRAVITSDLGVVIADGATALPTIKAWTIAHA